MGTQTSLLIADGANSQITAKDTTLIGGMIANATRNEDGTLTDHGQLNLTTETLTVADLQDRSESEQSGWGFQTGTGRSADKKGNTLGYGGGTTTVSMSHEGHVREGETRATLGLGNISVGCKDVAETNSELNRDINEAQITTKDQQTAGLNAGVTVDNRIFTEAGRASLLNDQKNLGENSKKAAGGAARDLLHVTGTYSAYEVMFTEDAKMYAIKYDADGKPVLKADGSPERELMTAEQMKNLVRGEDGKLYIFNNGIFTSEDGAAKNAVQLGVPREDEENINRNQYFIEFKEASNPAAELVVAGYQKFLEGDFWGLTNPTQLNVDMINQYGATGLTLDGHSRGTMTIGNAMQSVLNSGGVGLSPGLDVNFFGPAYNANEADGLLSQLQGGAAATQNERSVHYQNHADDPIGTFVGGNPASGGVVPEGSSDFKEMLRALGNV